MAKKHTHSGPVDFAKYEALNIRLQTLFEWPATPFEGQVLYRSDLKLGTFYDGTGWLFFGVSGDIMAALLAANSPDAANPFATLDDIPITPEDFIDLLDVPSAYTGQGGKFVAVKATEDGLEFVTVSLDLSAYMVKAANLSDVVNPSTARENIGAQMVITGTKTEGYVATIVGGVETWAPASGGGGGEYLTLVAFSSVILMTGNFKSVHTQAAAIAYTLTSSSPTTNFGNRTEHYIAADGVSGKPTFSSSFVKMLDNWNNGAGKRNLIVFKILPSGLCAYWIYDVSAT